MSEEPCLNAALLDFLEDELCATSRVLEIGGGYSTFWFRDRAGTVETIEDNPDWARKLGVEPLYWAEVLSSRPTYDVVLVDCTGERDVCAQMAWANVSRGGVLVWDDAQRSVRALESFGGLEIGPDERDLEGVQEINRIAKVWRKP